MRRLLAKSNLRLVLIWLATLAVLAWLYQVSVPLAAMVSVTCAGVILLNDYIRRSEFRRKTRSQLQKLTKQQNLALEELDQFLELAPLVKGKKLFRVQATEVYSFDNQYREILNANHGDFYKPIEITAKLVALPYYYSRVNAVAIISDFGLLGFVADQNSFAIYRRLVDGPIAIKVKAQIIIASRPEMNVCKVDLPKRWLK